MKRFISIVLVLSLSSLSCSVLASSSYCDRTCKETDAQLEEIYQKLDLAYTNSSQHYEDVFSETASNVTELQKSSKRCSCNSQDSFGKWASVVFFPILALGVRVICDFIKAKKAKDPRPHMLQ
jgi:hypothetical protein